MREQHFPKNIYFIFKEKDVSLLTFRIYKLYQVFQEYYNVKRDIKKILDPIFKMSVI